MYKIIKSFYNKHKTFVKYGVIGCSGASLDFIIFSIMVNIFSIHYLIANIFSVLAGITNNFIWNAKLNFKVEDKLFKRYFKFLAVGIFGLAISQIMLYISIDILKLNELLSKIITIGIITIIQYILNKTLTFETRSKKCKN